MAGEQPQNPSQQKRDDTERSSPPGDSRKSSRPANDPSVETLREILFSGDRQRIAELKAELDNLEQRITDPQALVAIISPVLGDAIRRKIRDAREEMTEALYPIIGQMVVRAVSEAIRDLARTVDAQLRTSFSLQRMGRRLQAQASGVSSAEMVLREALPFNVSEVFLIHRESGLLLWHISRDATASSDSDLISGMLTAIRDFVAESFGRGEAGDLDEIQYGDRSILIETAQYAYLAVVIDGTEPLGFRAEMRERVIEVDHAHERTLRHYDGDPTPLAPVEKPLRSLISSAAPPQLSSAQKWILAGMLAFLGFCLVGTGLAGSWAWQTRRTTPTPLPIVVAPTPTFTPTPSPTPTLTSTPTPTSSPTPSPTLTPTFTPSPSPTFTPTPAPVTGVMTGNVWLREQPSATSPRLGIILERGQPIEVLAVSGDWYQVHWSPQAEAEVIGWAPAEWVGTINPIPARIITPASNP